MQIKVNLTQAKQQKKNPNKLHINVNNDMFKLLVIIIVVVIIVFYLYN